MFPILRFHHSSQVHFKTKRQVTEIMHQAVLLHWGSPKSHLALAWRHHHCNPVFFSTNEMAKLVLDSASQEAF